MSNCLLRGGIPPTVSDKFGKSVFPDTFQGIGDETGTLFIAAITPSIHYTMGGVRISPDAEVLRVAGASNVQTTGASEIALAPIPGLFAAGEVTGGVHGANRLAGNSLLECAVFGRIAGERAADILHSGLHPLRWNAWTELR